MPDRRAHEEGEHPDASDAQRLTLTQLTINSMTLFIFAVGE